MTTAEAIVKCVEMHADDIPRSVKPYTGCPREALFVWPMDHPQALRVGSSAVERPCQRGLRAGSIPARLTGCPTATKETDRENSSEEDNPPPLSPQR